jgi:SAM-dependent methyltransferase
MEENAYRQFRDLERSHWWFRGRHAIFRTVLQRRVVPLLGAGPVRALDLGCGVGGHLKMLRALGEPVGVDLEADAARACLRRGFPRVVEADGTKLPFGDGAFDLVTAFDAVEHIPDDAAALAECRRVLRPGGVLFLSGPAYQFLYTHQDRVVHHCRRYTLGSLFRLFANAGFRVEHASYINAILFPGILPVLLLTRLRQKIRPPDPGDQRSNASIWFPKWLDALLRRIFAFERHVVSRVQLPFGHSLIVVGRKI